LKGHWFFWKFL